MTKIEISPGRTMPDCEKKRFPSLDFGYDCAITGSKQKPLRKIFGDFILERCFVHFPSERSSGKSWLGMSLCIAVSSQWKSFCNEEINIWGNTLYINLELDKELVNERLYKLYSNPPQPINDETYKPLFYTTRNCFSDERETIIDIIKEYSPILIVIDNLRMAFRDSDGNSNRDTTNFITDLLAIKDEFQCSILLTDHTKKGTRNLLTESDLQSGASSKSDLADGDFFLRKSSQDETYRILKRSKSRKCSEHKNAKLLRLNPESLWFEVLDEDVNEALHIGNGIHMHRNEKIEIAKQLSEKEVSFEEIGKQLGVVKSTVSRWVNGK